MNSQNTVWLIDAAYAIKMAIKLGFKIDWIKLRRCLEHRVGAFSGFYEAYYLNSAPDAPSQELTRFHHWLRSAPPQGPQIMVHLYPLKSEQIFCQSCKCSSTKKIQKGVDVGIATLLLTTIDKYDAVVLLAGDGDFVDAVKYAKTHFKKKIVIAGFTGAVSTVLQSIADHVIWLDHEVPVFKRTHVA
ncbi:MAG TPA: NYN domain-containing protein [Oculatellaceae cyanobacterium]